MSTLLDVTGGETLYVEVGGPGTEVTVRQPTPGGFNGGGAGSPAAFINGIPGAGGGGASDVRTVSATTPGSLDSRLVVAGVGGGAAAGIPGGSSSLTGSSGGTPDSFCYNEPPGAAGIGGSGAGGNATSGGLGGAGAPYITDGLFTTYTPAGAGAEGAGG